MRWDPHNRQQQQMTWQRVGFLTMQGQRQKLQIETLVLLVKALATNAGNQVVLDAIAQLEATMKDAPVPSAESGDALDQQT